MKLIIIILFCWFISLNGHSITPVSSEKVYLNTDRPLYISGENIWYKVICLNAGDHSPSRLSKAVYVELIDYDNQRIAEQIISLDKGSGNGMIEIPENLPSGNYYIRAYTAWMKNFKPEYYFTRCLKILNPFLPILEKHSPALLPSADSTVTAYLKKNSRNDPKPEIENLQLNYGNREKVKIDLHLVNLQGMPLISELSIAVVLDDEEKQVKDMSVLDFLQADDSPARIDMSQGLDSVYLPEPEGLVLSGYLRNKFNDSPEVNKAVYFSWVGGNRFVKLDYSNTDGRFFFRIPDGEGHRQIIVQAPGSSDECQLTVDNRFSNRFATLAQTAFDLHDFSKDYLEQLLLDYQVGKAYKTKEMKTVPKSYAETDFYGKPDEKFILDNYIKLPVMEEFFRELVKSTLLVREKNTYRINVLDGNLNRIIGPDPGYLIDGVPVFQASAILQSDPQVFTDIRVINSRYFHGKISWDGLIDLSTRAGDFSDFDLPPVAVHESFQLFEPCKEFVPVQYDSVHFVSSRIPDYRTLLLWNPCLKTGPDGTTGIEFTTSDVAGKYKIVIQGITLSGEPVFIEKDFHVRKR